jgi:hypothetical protein
MTLREIWWQKTDWLKYQRGFHDAGHAGIMGFLVFLVFSILFACGMSLQDALQWATYAGMVGGVGWEVIPKAIAKFKGQKGETPASMFCDVAQFWAFTPIALTLLGNWYLAIPWAVVLWLWYTTALKAMYK